MKRYEHKREKTIRPIVKLTERDMYGLVIFDNHTFNLLLGRIKGFDNQRQTADVVFDADGRWDELNWLEYPAVRCLYQDLALMLGV